MESYAYISIKADRGKDPEMFQRLMSIPGMLEVLMVEDSPEYLATVDANALSGARRMEDFLRKLRSVKGVRRVNFQNESN